MKNVIFIVLGAIVLGGCTAVGHHLSRDSGFSHTVKVLSPMVERELGEIAEIDVKDISLVLAIDKKNLIHILRSKNYVMDEADFPIKVEEVAKITSISLVNYEGSDCTILETSGTSKTFCPIQNTLKTGSTKSEHYSSVKDRQHNAAPYPPVKVLSQAAERELGEGGINDISLLLAFDNKGNINVVRSDSVMDERVRLPD